MHDKKKTSIAHTKHCKISNHGIVFGKLLMKTNEQSLLGQKSQTLINQKTRHRILHLYYNFK